MDLHIIIKNFFIILFFIPAFAWSYDGSYPNKVHCPSLPLIQQNSQQINAAQKINNEYLVYTAVSVFRLNNLWWYIGVGNIVANSSEDALMQGKAIALNINNQENIYASKQGNEFICKYGPGRVEARGKNLS